MSDTIMVERTPTGKLLPVLVVMLLVGTAPASAATCGDQANPQADTIWIVSASGDEHTDTRAAFGGTELGFLEASVESDSDGAEADTEGQDFEVSAEASSSARAGEDIEFNCTASPTVEGTSFTWTFGTTGETSSTAQTFDNPGKYTVSCTRSSEDEAVSDRYTRLLVTTTDHCLEPVVGANPDLLAESSAPDMLKNQLTGSTFNVDIEGEGTIGFTTDADGRVTQIHPGGHDEADYRTQVPNEHANRITEANSPGSVALQLYKDGQLSVEPGPGQDGVDRAIQQVGLTVTKVVSGFL